MEVRVEHRTMKRNDGFRLMIAGAMLAGCLWGCESIRPHTTSMIEDLPTGPTTAGLMGHSYLMKDLVDDQLGPTGGFLIAAAPEKFDQHKEKEAITVSQKAEQSPATVADARNSVTADLNGDGYVTLDEVVALKHAGLSDAEIVSRLDNTHQVFSLTPEQERYLTDRGISHDVANRIYELAKMGSAGAIMAGAPTTRP